MKINKGDIILICILFATLCLFAINEFNILIGLEQISGNFTNLFAVIFGGELLTFAIYKIGMNKYDSKKEVDLVKYNPANMTNSKAIQEIEKDMKEIEEMEKEKQEDNKEGKQINEQINES